MKNGVLPVAVGLSALLFAGSAAAGDFDDATSGGSQNQTRSSGQSLSQTESSSDAPNPEDTEFSSLVERHAKLVVFVRRLAAQHEELLSFERAIERALRAALLLKQLEAERAAQEQRAFDEQVSRFLRVRSFMKKLESSRRTELSPRRPVTER